MTDQNHSRAVYWLRCPNVASGKLSWVVTGIASINKLKVKMMSLLMQERRARMIDKNQSCTIYDPRAGIWCALEAV